MSILDDAYAQLSVVRIIFLILVLYIVKVIFDIVSDPLRDVPGPFVARFSRFWLLRQYLGNDFHQTNIKLHEQYGPIVRIAPNQYSIDSPDAAKVIYGQGSDFTKSDWYKPFGHPDPIKVNLFNDLNPQTHDTLRRRIASAYSMSSMLSYEPYVDDCTTILLQRLSELGDSGVAFNMGQWFQCYAFELIGMITFTKRLGFLNQGEDIRGIMEQLNFGTMFSGVMGLASYLYRPLLTIIMKLGSKESGIAFVDSYTAELINAQRHEKLPDADGPSDFITKFLALQEKNPAKMTDRDIHVSINGNLAAGSDTTGITLTAILYYLLKNPETLRKLREELDTASNDGRVSDPITFKEAQELPYLQAVIKESLRIHPAVGFTMPRVVPKGGTELMGRYFPGGTTVGINPWVAHRNREVFGADANLFRPERWTEDREGSSRREAYSLPFGQGSRSCIGRNISMLEVSKAIPQVIRYMDFELQTEEHWNIVTHWFAKPMDFNLRVKPRKQ